MKKERTFWLFVVGLIVSTAAYAGSIVHGQLVDAQLENLSSDPTGHAARVYYNTTSHVLKWYNDNASAWRTLVDTTTAFSNPMTTTGDIIYSSDNSGTPARLAIGASSTVLHGGTTPAYSQVVNADVSASAAILGSKLAAATSSVTGSVSYEDSGTFSCAFTGPCSSTVTCRYSRTGKNVALIIPGFACTSSSGTTFTASGAIAAGLRPSTLNIVTLGPVQDTTVQTTPGVVQITTGGTINVWKSEILNNFGASGTVGMIENLVVSYTVN